MLALGVPSLISAIGGILGIANESRKLAGGRVRLRRLRGKGLSPMSTVPTYVGAGLKHKKKRAVKHRKGRGLLFPAGRGLSPMYITRPYVGAGIKRHKKKARRGKGMLTAPGGHMLPLLKQLVMPSTSYLVNKRIPVLYTGDPFKNRPKPVEMSPKSYNPLGLTITGGKLTKRILRKRLYGRGVVADTLAKIPLLGGILAPIARALGGKLKKGRTRGGLLFPAGRGLSPMYIARPYVGAGVKRKRKTTTKRKGGRHGNLHRMSNTIRSVLRGGSLVPRKGYYRAGPKGKRVHVRATVVRVGAGTKRKGGYLPYTWGPNLIKC